MSNRRPLPASSSNSPLDSALAGDGGTLAHSAYLRIRADIIDGHLEPGTPLKLETLRQRYEMGLSPIREALSRLASDTFVTSIENRGYRVAEISRDDLADITDTRVLLERRALQQAIALGGEDWEAGIVAAHYRLAKADARLQAMSREVMDEWERANRGFHDALVAACPSRWLARFRQLLQDQSKRYRQLSVMESASFRDVRGEHEALMEATLARDSARACELIERHIVATAELVIDKIPAGAAT